MKTMIPIRFLFLALGAITIMQACQKEDDSSSLQNSVQATQSELKSANANVFYGPTQPLGHGVVRSWISLSKNGTLLSVGVNISEMAIESLPAEPVALVLPFPTRKGVSFYTHALLDWNPQGHEPDGVYTVPHFDFHFYTISSAARMAIGPLDPPAYDLAPAAAFIPPAYLQTPGLVPAMGAHWIDLQSPEFNGGTFTKTFIWGSYQGEFVFWEPMVTLDYLLSKPNDLEHLRQPEAFQRTGWYPQDYKVAWSSHGHYYSVALMNLAYQEARERE